MIHVRTPLTLSSSFLKSQHHIGIIPNPIEYTESTITELFNVSIGDNPALGDYGDIHGQSFCVLACCITVIATYTGIKKLSITTTKSDHTFRLPIAETLAADPIPNFPYPTHTDPTLQNPRPTLTSLPLDILLSTCEFLPIRSIYSLLKNSAPPPPTQTRSPAVASTTNHGTSQPAPLPSI